jgi:hypothetical protein
LPPRAPGCDADSVDENDDSVWLGLCCLAAIGMVVAVLLIVTTERGTTPHSLAPLGVLPCAALGLARRVRRAGGNATHSLQQVFNRERTSEPRRYSRAFAVYLLLTYAFAVVIAVATWGLSFGVWLVIVVQGAVTAFVVTRTSWVAMPPPRA